MTKRTTVLGSTALLVLLLLGIGDVWAKKGGGGKPPPELSDPAITYVNARKAQIAVIDADGSNATPAYTYGGLAWHPTWSPDGASIAFLHYLSGHNELWRVDLDGSNAIKLVSDGAERPFWSPQGDEIGYVHDGNEIRLVPAEGGAHRTVYTAPSGRSVLEYLAFNPEGTELAFVALLPPEVRVLDLASGDSTILHAIVPGGDDRWEDLDWARTKDVLALRHSGTISTYDMATGVLTELFAGRHPSWSPDDTKLTYGSTDGGAIWTYTFETGEHQRVVRRGMMHPDWRR